MTTTETTRPPVAASDPIDRALRRANPTKEILVQVGGFYATALETFKGMFRRAVQWREFLDQAWFRSYAFPWPASAGRDDSWAA